MQRVRIGNEMIGSKIKISWWVWVGDAKIAVGWKNGDYNAILYAGRKMEKGQCPCLQHFILDWALLPEAGN